MQLPLAGIVRPVSVSAVAPAAKLFPDAPVQVPPAAPAALICMFASVSVKFAPVTATPLLFDSVKVIVLVPLAAIEVGAKALAIVGATAVTVRFAVLEAAPVGALALATPDVAFGWTPGMLLVTTTVTVQLPLAGTVSPLKLSAVAAAAKLLPAAPVQVPPAAPAALMLMFASVSVKLAPVTAMPLLLASVNVIVLVALAAMLAGAKALAIVGAAAVTVRLAVFETAPVGALALATPDVAFG